MEIQLNHTEPSSDTGCPVLRPQLGVAELHRFAEQAAKHSENIGSHPDAESIHHIKLVLNLCVALWGTLPEFQHDHGKKSLLPVPYQD